MYLPNQSLTKSDLKSSSGTDPVCNDTVAMDAGCIGEAWSHWLRCNIESGCDVKELGRIMLENGFSKSKARSEISRFKLLDSVRMDMSKAPFQQTARRYPNHCIELYEFEGFLDRSDCNQLIDLANKVCRPSLVTTGERGFRTSLTSELSEHKHHLIEQLDRQICDFVGIDAAFSEPIEAQIYRPGDEFKAHMDCFDNELDAANQQLSEVDRIGWQRTWTFMQVLQASELGGATFFQHLQDSFKPVVASGLLWNNLTIDGLSNAWTLHAGQKVEQGGKIIITKWFKDL